MEMKAAHGTPLLTALEQLTPRDHLCSIYESPEEHFAVAIPFIRIGLDRGEQCIYIADDGTQGAVQDAMHAHGIDVERAVATRSLILEGKEAAYLKDGSFDPDWMFTFWANATAEAMRQGFSALRATGETEWVLRGAPGLERWMEYESRLMHVLAHHNCSALCQYDRKLFPPELILDVIRTHPTVIYRGVVCRNMYYVPPDEFLGANQAAREVERLLTNITEREEIEYTLRRQRNELQDSEVRFREIAESIREVFWVLDLVGDRITFVSPMYEEMFGRSCATLYADYRSHFELIRSEDRARMEAALLQARTGTPIDERYRVIRPDGSIRWIRARSFPVRATKGTIERLVGVAEDITDRKNTEDELQRSEHLLRLVLDALPVGVGVVDVSGNIILSNPASQRIWAGSIRSGAERYVESQGWWHATGERLRPDEWASVRAVVNGETSVNEVLEIEAFDGARKIIQNSAVPIRDANDRITGAVVLNEDITARKAAERELSDSYDQMGRLTGRLMRAQDDERRRIAQMLHETTAQDLAALKMLLAGLARRGTGLPDADRAALSESIDLAERSMTGIRTLSYLLHPPFLDDSGLLSALRWYTAGFAKRSGIKVTLDLPSTFERLPQDVETALFRVVQEALINIHHHAESPTALIRLRVDEHDLTLEIRDHGRGMPSELAAVLPAGGGALGVGVAGMHQRLQQLHGTLDIESSDQGTTVRVRLPLEKDMG